MNVIIAGMVFIRDALLQVNLIVLVIFVIPPNIVPNIEEIED